MLALDACTTGTSTVYVTYTSISVHRRRSSQAASLMHLLTQSSWLVALAQSAARMLHCVSAHASGCSGPHITACHCLLVARNFDVPAS